MKRLVVNDEVYYAEKIIMQENNIVGYTNDREVFAFRGISDFSLFEILDGAFDPDHEQEKEQRIADLETAIVAILGGGV